MRYQKLNIVVAVVCLLTACGCSGCGKNSGPGGGELLVTAVDSGNALDSGKMVDSGNALGSGSTLDSGNASDAGNAVDSKNASDSGNAADTENMPNPEFSDVSGEEVSSGAGGISEAARETAAPCYVHICGEVVSPGVYELEAGSRVFQAVEVAGGFTENAAAEYLNMAEPVGDGMKIVVPDIRTLDEAAVHGTAAEGGAAVGVIDGGSFAGRGAAGGNPADPGASAEKQKVNINTAAKEELMTLKGIGESKAEDIISYRESHGGFSKIEDIMKISGIKSAAFDKIKDDITV